MQLMLKPACLMRKQGLAFPVFLVISACLLPSAAFGGQSNAERLLDKVEKDLNLGKFKSSYLKPLRVYTRSPEDTIRSRAVAAVARCIDEIQGQPLGALRMIAPHVLKKETAETWLKQVAGVRADRSGRYENGRRIPEKFPPFTEWDIRFPEVGVQTAKILASLEEYEAAFDALRSLWSEVGGVRAVLAAEAAGDILIELDRHEQALEFYQHALQALHRERARETSEERPDDILARAAERLWWKESWLKDVVDTRRYGAGFVAYRNARTLEIKEKDYFRAAAAYARVIDDFPDTVYSEAATVYRARCLFELTDRNDIPQAQKALTEEKASYAKIVRKLKKRLHTAPEELREQWQEEIKEKKKTCIYLEKTPVGRDAESEALDTARSFVESNEHGLYRGEAMILIAEYCLRHNVDVKNSAKWYERAYHWSQNIAEHDRLVDTFQVPGKAFAVTAPPASEYKLNAFGFNTRADIEPEAVFNRNTSPWYMMWISKKACLGFGFCCLINGQNDEAYELFCQLERFDDDIRLKESFKTPNTMYRLKAAAETGFIRGRPHEIACFSGKRRTALMLAEFKFASRQTGEAERIYRALIKGRYGSLNTDQEAYAAFGVGSCRYMLDDFAGAAEEFKGFRRKYANTPIGPRGLYCLGQSLYAVYNYADNEQDKKNRSWKNVYSFLARKHGDIYWGKRADFRLGMIYAFSDGSESTGRQRLKRFISRHPKTSLAQRARELLNIVRNNRNQEG